MKKVIFKQKDNVINVSDVTDDMIVGILWEDGDKSFLIKDDNGFSVGIGLNSLTTKKHWSGTSHEDYIRNTNNAKDFFVFDSPKELAQWLAD